MASNSGLTGSGQRAPGVARGRDDGVMSRSMPALAGIVATVLLSLAPPAAAAPPAGACATAEGAHPVVAELPWAQRTLDPRRVWTHSTGAGVTVAVVDSGVDAGHPQLAGKVLPGKDFFLAGDLPGDFDCASHGTAVAGIIAAAPQAGVGFQGLAPGATVLPVRITDRDLADDGHPTPIDPVVLARGIWYAADSGAKVLNLSLSGYADDPMVHDAIRHAQQNDVLVVAAVGNRGSGPSYPAMYDGVLGVGSIDIGGHRAQGSQVGSYVDIVAPGAGVLSTTRAGGHDYFDGTSFAAPFVTATAALVRAAAPNLSAAEVADRLIATATPMPGGAGSLEYGAGLVDPYRAVTEGLTTRPAAPLPSVVPTTRDHEAESVAAWWARQGSAARAGVAVALAATLLGTALIVVLRRGKRRRWTPARTRPLPPRPDREPVAAEPFLLPGGH